MKACLSSILAGTLLVGLLFLQTGYSEDQAEEGEAKVQKADNSSGIGIRLRLPGDAHLPNHLPRLALTKEQKEQVAEIQEKYGYEIAQLEKQVIEKKAKRDEEIRQVLSEKQQQQLDDLRAEAAARAQAMHEAAAAALAEHEKRLAAEAAAEAERVAKEDEKDEKPKKGRKKDN